MPAGARRAVLNVASFVLLMAVLVYACVNDSPPVPESQSIEAR